MASLAASLLVAPDAQAGIYTVAYSGGNVTPADVGTIFYPFSPGGRSYSASGAAGVNNGRNDGSHTIKIDDTTQINATFTWTHGKNPDGTTQTDADDPPPSAVVVSQYSDVFWSMPNGSNGSGSVSAGLPNPATVTNTSGTTTTGVESFSMNYAAGAGGASFHVSCTPTASFTGSYGTASVSYSATAFPVTVGVGGTTPDSSNNPNILVGQQATGTLTGSPDNFGNGFSCGLSNFRWNVSGTTFESWSQTTPQIGTAPANSQASYFNGGPIPATNSTSWYWNDLSNKSETVACTAAVTPPTGDGAPFDLTVTAPQQVSVQVPDSGSAAVGGYMQVNTALSNDTPHYNLWAGPTAYESLHTGRTFTGGMNWQATVTTPTTPAFGTGSLELVQLVSPNNSYTTVANPTKTVSDPENQNSKSLDLNYPYGHHVALEANKTPSGLVYQDNDSPGLQLDGATVLATASKNGSYIDYLMYMPPVATNSASTWVLLGTFSWSANGSATMPGNKDGSPLVPGNDNWSFYTSTTGAPDSAGAVTPPGSNPDQNSLPPSVPFTAVTAPNTFPKWTHIDLGKTF